MSSRLRHWTRTLVQRVVRPFAGILHDEIQAFAEDRRQVESRRLRRALQSCGVGVRFGRGVHVSHPRSASIASDVRLDDDVRLETEGGLTIGPGTFISRGVTIRTTSQELRGEALPRRPVHIGREVWIGPGATIEPGSRIGDGAVVGAGAVVEGTIEPGAIVSSPPPLARGHAAVPAEPGGRPGAAITRFVFVPSTGRSGTMTIARLLSRHPDIVCRHEPRPQLIRLSTELAHGDIDEEAARAELDAIYRQSSVYPAPVYGESDHRLFNLFGMLAEMLPSTRVLWLVRDGRAVVASTVARGWYGEEFRSGLWGEYRLIGDRCGDVPPDRWGAMSLFERNCWYWSYVNRVIERQLRDLAPDRWRRVRLEDVDAAASSLFEFLEVAPLAARAPHENPSRWTVVPHSSWSLEQKQAFERICGDLMDRWYEGWREGW